MILEYRRTSGPASARRTPIRFVVLLPLAVLVHACGVFDPDSAWPGDLEMPDRFEPLRILDDQVLGVGRDAIDVQHFQVYGLDRDPRP